MATAEFEELKLSVVLVDDASTGLAALRQEMRQFEGDSIRFIKSARDNAEALKRVGRETDEVVKGLRATGNVLTKVGSAIGTVTATYYGTVVWLAKFALEVEQVANAAQLAGVSYADLRNVSEQMARKGLSPETGGRILSALNSLGSQLQSLAGIHDWENRMRASNIALDPVQADAYVQAMIKAKGWAEREAIVRNALESIEAKGRIAGLTDVQIKNAQKEFLIKQGLPEEMIIAGKIADTTKAQKDKYGLIHQNAKLWNEVTHKIIKNVKTILAILNDDSMDENGPFFWMLKTAVSITGYIDKHIGEWITTIQDAGAWLAKTFGGSPEGKGEEKPAEGLGDFMMPPAEPMGGDDTPLKLEKLILEFRKFSDSLRNAAIRNEAPAVPQERYASLGSIATPGLQLPPAAMAGDVYTDKYGIWPGGGAKPAGSDVGPGGGAGAMGVSGGGGPGSGKWPWGSEGRFRSSPRGRFTPGGIPLSPIYRGRRGGGGAADGDDTPGGHYEELPKVPGDFRMPGGTGPRGSYKNVVAQPDYLAGTEPSTNIQDVRGGSWGGAGGAGGTSQPPHLGRPGSIDPEKSIFVPGLDVPAPRFPTSKIEMLESEQPSFALRRERQTFEPGSMRDLIQKSPGLYRRGAEETRQRIERAQKEETEELSEPLAFPWRAPGGPRSGPGDLIPPGMDRAADMLDRSVLDRGMGNEMGGKLEGNANFTVDVNAPRGTEVQAEGSGILGGEQTINRQMPMEE